MTTQEQELWALFHKLWTKSVGTPGYNKREWLALEKLILAGLRK